MRPGESSVPQRDWLIPSISDVRLIQAEPHQLVTISMQSRQELATTLSAMRIQMDALIRLLNNCDKPIEIGTIEKLVIAYSRLCDISLNIRIAQK